jgi:uncharacterized protein (TIGR03435 family)
MLQALLEDRFKARVHVEAREVDGYALTIAKSGIKFKETSGDATAGRGAPCPVPAAPPPIARGARGRAEHGVTVEDVHLSRLDKFSCAESAEWRT